MSKNKNLCSKCRGNCCKNSPGILHPKDIKPLTIEKIVELLELGIYAIDWWEGDPRDNKYELERAYHLRIAQKGFSEIFHPGWSGACALLVEGIGCELSYKARPYQCRMLIPAKDMVSCEPKNEDALKQNLSIAWIPYNDILKKAGDIVVNGGENNVRSNHT